MMFKKQLIIVGLVSLLTACGSSPVTPPARVAPASPADTGLPEYLIQPGDELDIRFFATPELNEQVVVRPDGVITLPLVSSVRVAGYTPEMLDALLTERYSEQLLDPQIRVIVRSFGGQKIYVGGEVERPGVFDMTAPITVVEAAMMAGGFTRDSSPSEILIIRKGPDNRPYPIRVSVEEALAGADAQAMMLQSADVIYVPRSRIANANLFVDQYIRNLLMFGGVRVSFGYDLDELGF